MPTTNVTTPNATAPRFTKGVRRALVGSTAVAGAALLAIAAPLAAQAHVNVFPGQAEAGSYATLTFKVPNESATAGTIKLEVDLPQDTPFTSVSYLPTPGWTADIQTSQLPEPVQVHGSTVTEAPSKIVWTADKGVSITAGQFQEFVVSAGPVPDTGAVRLPVHQTYSDGKIVAWDEKPAAEEPEHPSPVLYINDAPADTGHGASVTAAPSAESAGSDGSTTDTAASNNSGVALGVGLGGLGLGAIALVLSVFTLVNRKTVTKL